MPSTPKRRKRAGKKGHSLVQTYAKCSVGQRSEIIIYVMHAVLREDGVDEFNTVILYEPRIRPSIEVIPNTFGQAINDGVCGHTAVELKKHEGYGLGLIISGGTDKHCLPHIANLRNGGIAHRSDLLQVGDLITSVNGICTANFKHDDIINLLKNTVGDSITLDINYELPSTGEDNSLMHIKHHEVSLEKEGGFGFTLRGGISPDNPEKCRPLTVTHIRPGGPAHREGSLKVGDRLLAVDGYNITTLTNEEAFGLLSQCEQVSSFLFEYDIAVMSVVQNATGPLLVEIEKNLGEPLGITLSQKSYHGQRCLTVDSICPASVADRCGALHVGDHILSIDGANVDHMSLAEATQLLISNADKLVNVQILPISYIQQKAAREALLRTAMVPVLTSPRISAHDSHVKGDFSTHGSSVPRARPFLTSTLERRKGLLGKPTPSSTVSLVSNAVSMVTNTNQIVHSERTEVTLYPDMKGLGILLEGGFFSTSALSDPPTVAHIEPRSIAERCGVVQEGDRILTINGQDLVDRTLDEAQQLLQNSKPYCVLQIEFDVAESVMPSSGTFVVKLPKRPAGLGITLNKSRPVGPDVERLVIINVKPASIAHRCGSISPGDCVIAINDVRADSLTLDDASQLLLSSDEIVKLKLQKLDEDDIVPDLNIVTYTVELQRRGGPLGVTISGTETPFNPIIISGLTEGGLAHRTGALHIGDQLLAINGQATRGHMLKDAIHMLQTAGDTVTLKISRKLVPGGDTGYEEAQQIELAHDDYYEQTTPLQSVDSALECWDSSGPETIGTVISSSISPKSRPPPVPPRPAQRPLKAPAVPLKPIKKSTSAVSEKNNMEMHQSLPADSGDVLSDTQGTSDSDWSSSDHSLVSSVEDEWTRTFTDFETSGQSEMLKQIGASLRQRSMQSLSHIKSSASSECSESRGHQRLNVSNSRVNAKRKNNDGRFKTLPNPSRQNSVPPTYASSFQDNDWKTSTIAGHVGMSSRPRRTTPTGTATNRSPEIFQVVLKKQLCTDDFGFSLSDSIHDEGVFISALKPRGLADKAGLRELDKLLQVNATKTSHLDCCMVVPFIAQAGNILNLVISRHTIEMLRKSLPPPIPPPRDRKRHSGATPGPTSPLSRYETMSN